MKVLFIRFSSLGDTILTTGIMKKLKEMAPEIEIEVLTSIDFAAVWEGQPFISGVYAVSRGISLGNYIKELRKLPVYDYIFDLHANTRSGIARRILKGKKSVYGKQSLCRRLFVKFRLCRRKLQKHVVEKYAEAVFPVVGMPTPSLEELRPDLPGSAATALPRKVVIHPFASKNTKIWPWFDRLAEELTADGWQVYVAGRGTFPEIPGVVKVHTPTLNELFNLLGDAALVISTDSGPMHGAVALERPLVAIFGSTTRELGFYPEFEGCYVEERTDVLCRPCHVHGLDKCPLGHFRCMKEIAPEVVMATIKNIKIPPP